MYLRSAQPDLGIDNPYELDEDQFNAAVDLLKQQRENIGEYWFAYTEEQNGFANGDIDIGQSWQYTANLLTDADVPVKTVLPKEGATGWSDTWMISSEAKHPNCTYMWMDWVVSPKVNAADRRVLRRGAGEREVVRADGAEGLLRHLPRG